MNIPFQKHPNGAGFRAFFPTKSGKLNLSVVAGKDYYSNPRSDEDDSSVYTEVELAIFSGNEWSSKNQLQKVFEIIGQGEHEYNENMESPSNGVWGWIPVEKIQEIWEKC